MVKLWPKLQGWLVFVMTNASLVNLSELVDDLSTRLSNQELAQIRTLTKEQISSLHFTTGLMIRNHYIYPKTSKIGQLLLHLLGDADGISSIISSLLWYHLHGHRMTRNLLVELILDRFWMLEESDVNEIVTQLLA